MPSFPAGYSGTPLAAKLGVKPGCRVLAIGAPADYRDLLAPIPDGVRFDARAGAGVDIAHVFVTRRGDLAKRIAALRERLRDDAVVWVSWPKKSAKVDTDVTEYTIREVALPMGYVDVKVCAVNATWSGLKLVVRKALRRR